MPDLQDDTRGFGRPSWRWIRRVPLTLALVVILIVTALATQTAWRPGSEQPWFPQVAFGVPSFAAGRWWTLLTGAVFSTDPPAFVAMLVLVVIGVGGCELLLRTRRTALVVATTHAVGVLGGCLAVWALALTGWEWAVETAASLDAGLSAGALGAAAVASATLRDPWRWRVRLALLAVVLVPLVFLGYLADVIHIVAIGAGLPLGVVLAGRKVRPALPSISRTEVRRGAAAFFVLSAILNLLGSTAARNGPLGVFGGETPSLAVWIGAGVDVFIAVGLVRGRRTMWRVAVLLTGLDLIANVGLLTFATTLDLAREQGLLVLSLVLALAQLVVLVLGRSAFANPGRRARRRLAATRIGGVPTDEERSRATDLLVTLGSENRLSWIGTWSENRWWLPSDTEGYVPYQVHAGVAIGIGDPVAVPSEVESLADGFIDAVVDAGLTPCLFSTGERIRDWALDRGWLALPVALEAVIDLPELEFKGRRWQDIRTALNQARKAGIEHRLLRLDDAPHSVQAQLRTISSEWVGGKELPEMGFTLGGLEEAGDPHVWVSIAIGSGDVVHGFTSWLPAYGGDGRIDGWTLDVMRRADDSFRYTMEFVIASACLQFKADGYAFVSLSGAPLAQAADTDPDGLDQLVGRLSQIIEPYYGFGSLMRFKAKFMPREVPLYLVAADEAALGRAGVAIGRAYLAHATPMQLAAALRPPRSAGATKVRR